MDDLTLTELRRVLSYDPDTGAFRWNVAPLRSKVGDYAGFKGGKGYRQISISGTHYYEHRLATLYMKGRWPTDAVDHVDGDRSNNKWVNLREATVRQNAANMKKRKGKSSNLKGVSWMTKHNAWVAHIRISGKSTYLGMFVSEGDAHRAYLSAAAKEFGQFARAQ